ncbi:hypothetical protein [Alteromonas sp. RKMC-009]|uniref:hypothetical protein n=1 Tax=Alteromonas sp. RKMC-009 TaxID=2267264 RepID=UPI000E699169|nr:hypothetical protein [Alteromonas sp. RKMC-009]AYA64327.1 hypothetical protein DS731_10135 [Alteromonas sp. RKMC-009]
MSTDNAIKEIEISKKDAEKLVDDARAVNRLLKNRDFKRVITEGFFEKEAVRLVLLKSDPNFQSPEDQASLLTAMDGIGVLRHYLQTRLVLGDQASASIEDLDAELEELREEAE